MSIYNVDKENMAAIAPLFAGWQESLIWSCLQGCRGRHGQTDGKTQGLPESCWQISAFLQGSPAGNW